MFLQDTTSENESEIQFEKSQNKRVFKSPGKALLFSGMLPGMGQTYLGNWLRGLLFVGLDAAAIGTWYYNNNLSEDKKKEYSFYANEHWDFGRWVHDYYKWYPEDKPEEFLGNQELWNSIREVFVNKTDSISGCHESPYCYTDIWDHSHKVEFTWDGEIQSSSSEYFRNTVFEELCGNSPSPNRTCTNDSLAIAMQLEEHSVIVVKDHHFYEGIQKYDMFFAGWDDNDSVSVVTKQHGDKIATSPNQTAYRSLWGDYNKIKTLAGNGGKFMLINRVVSMVDALLLAKKWNNNHDLKLSLNAYPDLRNKTGLGGVKLALYWK
ncbi:MAG: hypothetical protein H8E85_02640 [Candidatus Marinimicrobia bacterium]|nr:hypothetical protein [Candidatus Neomarinimicrobiota bacterium]